VSAPPGRPAQDAFHEASNRAIKRRAVHLLRSRGIPFDAWMVRTAMTALAADNVSPTDEQIIEALMRADLHRKPSLRKWRLGEAAWRTRS
jgi:hypothetical protein